MCSLTVVCSTRETYQRSARNAICTVKEMLPAAADGGAGMGCRADLVDSAPAILAGVTEAPE